MSLQLGAALKRGAGRLVSRTGLVILAAYAAVMLVYQLSFNTLLQRALTGMLPPDAPGASVPGLLTLPVPNAAAGALIVVSLLAAAVVGIVAVRTFVADEREHIPRRFLTDRLAFAVVNLVGGGVVFGLVVLVGTLLLVVPGVVAYVGFLFMVQYVAVENDNFVTAMWRSWRLTKGSRLRVFLLVLVLFAVVFVVTFVVNLVVGGSLGAVFGSSARGVASLVVGMVNVVSTLYLLAVVSDAFVQLRGGSDTRRGPEHEQRTTDALGA